MTARSGDTRTYYGITVDDVNDWQASGEFHPLTCRQCRGRAGACDRTDVGNVAGDHHVLKAEGYPSHIVLRCECCRSMQPFPERLVGNVRYHMAARRHVYSADECSDRECAFRHEHWKATERWCEPHGRWAIGNPCDHQRVRTPVRADERYGPLAEGSSDAGGAG